ncbi:MAG TPA: TonB-dependent receptor [Micropepsaceae bacterium]|nr:TonB-dependent receptor [Micropepsaceae bacterium]
MRFPIIRGHSVRIGAVLLGSASLLTMVSAMGAQAQLVPTSTQATAAPPVQTAQATQQPTQVAQAQTAQATGGQIALTAGQVPEQVLVTGSLIHGAASVGVPVTTFGDQDFKQTGGLTIGDIFKDVPAVYQIPQNDVIAGGGYIARAQNLNLRNLSTHGSRQLLLIDGMRFPNQGRGGCQTDPSIIPQLAVDRVDLLTDGASATYGSDAIVGVINVLLKRGYDGALSQLQYSTSTDIGHPLFTATQLYGRTWDGGDITVSYEWYKQRHTNGAVRPYFTQDFFAFQGLDDRRNIINSRPGVVTVGAATAPAGTPAGFAANLGQTCSNCFSIPTGQNGVGLSWASVLAHPGVHNQVDLFADGWAEPDQQRNAGTATFDQKITSNVSLFADGWISNRQALMHAQSSTNSFNAAVPTINPFYPTLAPAGLRINYDLNLDLPSPQRVVANEIAGRYDLGLNISLPHDWLARVYGAVSKEHNTDSTTGTVNPNMVSAALGWTINAVPANGATPFIIPSFTKPSNVPYLNVFCDPTAFTCNDPATLSYVTGFSNNNESEIVTEYGATADGPVYDLPGGTIRAAVGTLLTHTSYSLDTLASNANNALINNHTTASGRRTVYSAFAQFNIPILGDGFNLPLAEKLVLESSVRWDKYSDVGPTINPKVALDWDVGYGLTLKGSWGTAFRAAEFQEGNPSGPSSVNQLATATNNTVGTCPVVGVPAVPGSIAALIDPNCSAALQFLGGLTTGLNGFAPSIRPAGYHLQPETAQNLSGGFEFAPSEGILKGLDIQATYWYIRMRNVINGYFGLFSVQTGQLDNPAYTAAFLTAANDPNYAAHVQALLASQQSTLQTTIAPNISFIADTGNRNVGWQAVNGVDFQASYDWDMGDWGAWNTGFTGTYVMDNKTQFAPGTPPISLYYTPQSPGNPATDTGGRLKYRARLGWASDDGWSVTGFVNFLPHFNSDTAPLPPACFMIGNTACDASGLPQFAQYTTQYKTLTNFVPGLYTFDLSFGYKTGNTPANDYLKNLGFQLTINNILDKQAPFAYQISPPGGAQAHAYFSTTAGSSLGIDGRVITFVITKAW